MDNLEESLMINSVSLVHGEMHIALSVQDFSSIFISMC